MRFRVVPVAEGDRWEIRTYAYSYLLFHEDREIVGYHWDHEGVGGGSVRTPHAHLGKDLPHVGLPREDRDRLDRLAAAHLPTGLIPFTAILRAAMRDFGLDPLRRQGDGIDDARRGAVRTFSEAEATLMASFDWWSGRVSVAE